MKSATFVQIIYVLLDACPDIRARPLTLGLAAFANDIFPFVLSDYDLKGKHVTWYSTFIFGYDFIECACVVVYQYHNAV